MINTMIRGTGAVFYCESGRPEKDCQNKRRNLKFDSDFHFYMLTSCKGIFENGKIELSEDAPVLGRTEVIVTFLNSEPAPEKKQRVPGGLKARFELPPGFNEPLDDLKEYM